MKYKNFSPPSGMLDYQTLPGIQHHERDGGFIHSSDFSQESRLCLIPNALFGEMFYLVNFGRCFLSKQSLRYMSGR